MIRARSLDRLSFNAACRCRGRWNDQTRPAAHAGHGACWAVIAEKYRLILFGRYPYEEHWRPLARACCCSSACCVVSSCIAPLLEAVARCWSGSAALSLFGVLMWGGVLGLPFVDDGRCGAACR